MANKFDAKVLKVYRHSEAEHMFRDLRVVVWIIDGKSAKPRLENREFVKRQDGNFVPGKCKGMDFVDMKTILDNYEEVMGFLEHGDNRPTDPVLPVKESAF